jgi:23S rRNA (cytidine1920-2'-O)/16S rRNA (cytidine1409-2'-O)-methyltransferase
MSFQYEVVVMRAAWRSLLTAHSSSSTFRLVKKRVDLLLVERGLAESRSQAQALILAGLVHGHDKPGDQVEETAELEVERPPRFVSRGGEKLANAIERLGVDPAGKDALDVGASTGGFTDCLLQAGASRVIALDVGYGQLHPRLRADSRVVVLERVNARELDALPFAPELVTCDVSFISVLTALPPALRLSKPGWEALVLVKPQFEAGRAQAPKGVARDPAVHRAVLHRVAEALPGLGARLVGVVDSGLPGPKGNREFFVHLIDSEEPAQRDDVDRWIDDAVGAPAASGH